MSNERARRRREARSRDRTECDAGPSSWLPAVLPPDGHSIVSATDPGCDAPSHALEVFRTSCEYWADGTWDQPRRMVCGCLIWTWDNSCEPAPDWVDMV